jgi:hypothetical protein
VAVAVATLLLAGCTFGPDPSPAPPTSPVPAVTQTPEPLPFELRVPDEPAVVLDSADPAAAALAASTAVFAAAPAVVLAASDDVAAQVTASSAAVALGAPLLLVAPAPAGTASPAAPDPAAPLAAELDRLGTEAVLIVGDAEAPAGVEAVRLPAGAGTAALAAVTGMGVGAVRPVAAGEEVAAVRGLVRPGTLVLRALPPAPDPSAASGASAGSSGGAAVAGVALGSSGDTAAGTLPPTTPATTAPAGTVALAGVGGEPLAALATLRAAGIEVLDVPTGDPRATSAAIEALAAAAPEHVIALGAGFGPADRLAARVASAEGGIQLPGGGQLVFPQDLGLPGKRYVALYGSPAFPALGVLGEQDTAATIARTEQHAVPYRALTADTVVPGVEIIATVASAGAGDDGNYSNELPVDTLRPLVDAAGEAGMTVVLDLQPGRTDFLTQAKLYEELLRLPHVGLALDPEWRLKPDQVHLRQIGSVPIDEVNAVSAWLAQLVRDNHLPQKMFILHQFMLRMLPERERLDMSHDELAMMIHVDGQGHQGSKVGTWNAIREGAPAGIHWGWKNFYDEDEPTILDPAGTYRIVPVPDLVTYQ